MIVRSSARGTFLGCAGFPGCRGALDAVEAVAERSAVRTQPTGGDDVRGEADGGTPVASAWSGELEVGRFVRVHEQMRTGVIRAEEGALRQVAFIDVPGRREGLEWHEAANLEPADLATGTTVWAKTGAFGFRPGTVKASHGRGAYLIRFSFGSREPDELVDERALVVRAGSDFHHPVDALKVGLVDHVKCYLARVHALRSFVRQRTACQGFTAVLSAAVRPFRHQVNVLAQVMSDTVRRYVLADEVGLGKTIEAGLIIRQVLLDDPNSRVLVAVPPTLIGQWEDELTYKLLLGGVFASRWSVVSHDDLSLAALRHFDLVVVDEAHRLAEAALASDVEAKIAEMVAARTAGLLLLTATPIRGNAEVFHYLLHLVDPVAHPKDDLEGFLTRLALREQLAQSIELLDDQAMPWELVAETLKEFAITFPYDDELQILSRRARSVGPDGARDHVIEVGQYLRETYRLSRRVVRNRRSAVPEFPTMGRQFQDLLVEDPAAPIIDEFLERWRDAVQGRDGAAGRFCQALDAALAGAAALLPFLEQLRSEGVNDDERYAIDTLAAQLEHVGGDVRLAAATDWLATRWARGTDKIVVATSFEVVARALAERLEHRIGALSVASHLQSMHRRDADTAVRNFLRGDRARILIVDRSAEEGRNLQEADLLLHLDIPLSVNRLEQRIGRLDRFGKARRGQRKQNVAIRTGSVWEQARDDLHGPVGVRDHSVATLQRPLAELEETLTAQLVRVGVSAIEAAHDGLSARLEAEREEIDRLDELEAFAGRDGFTTEQFERLEDLEENWGDVQSAVDHLTDRNFGLHLTRFKVHDRPGLFEYTTPGDGTLPKIPQDRLEQLGHVLHGRRTFSRPIAERSPGVQIVRMGDPMVDWLASFISTDERGRARAIQRHCPGLGVPQLWFQFDLLFESDVPSVDDALSVPARTLRRIGDGYLPPRTLRLWSDGLRPPEADFKANFLTAVPDGSSGDVPISGERWSRVLEWLPDFSVRAGKAWQEVKARASVDGRTRSAVADALERLRIEFDQRERTLERVRAVEGWRAELVDEDLVRLRWTRDRLRAGIEQPALRCIAVGAYVLTGEAPA